MMTMTSRIYSVEGWLPMARRRGSESKDDEYNRQEEDAFLSSLEKSGRDWAWMKEKKYKRMFNEIEAKLQGVLGDGPFEWVDRRVFDQVFDRLTLLSLYKLFMKGDIDTIEFPIARGKEAHVFLAKTSTGVAAVKIFHTSNAVFKNLIQYIEGDPRFGGLRRRHRDLVDIWVRKEHRNLLRMKKWGLNVPTPLALNKNVLVMEYIGDDESPAPRLRDIEVNNPKEVFDELLEYLAVSWQKADLAHGDFSPYNILWHDDSPVVIDVGQAVTQGHPKSKELLVRDVTRLVEWGQKQGIEVEVAEAMWEVLNMDLSELEPIED